MIGILDNYCNSLMEYNGQVKKYLDYIENYANTLKFFFESQQDLLLKIKKINVENFNINIKIKSLLQHLYSESYDDFWHKIIGWDYISELINILYDKKDTNQNLSLLFDLLMDLRNNINSNFEEMKILIMKPIDQVYMSGIRCLRSFMDFYFMRRLLDKDYTKNNI